MFVRHCRAPLGADRYADLEPHSGRLALERDLETVSETLELASEDVVWYLTELADPAETISILRIADASLEPRLLLDLAKLLTQAAAASALISSNRAAAPTLFSLVENLPKGLSKLAADINKKIMPSGEIDDSASPELRRIRRETNAMRGRLTKSLESIMRSKGDAIQDEIVTVRNERYVIPVKADFSGKVGGVTHGASSSGATVFIEPLEVIEANNELQKLKAKEEAEIARILFSLADEARSNLDGIVTAAEIVGELDFIKAKAEFAKQFDAVIPQISEDLSLEFVDARHPLLEASLREAVPGSKFQVSNSYDKKSSESKTDFKSTNLKPETWNLKPTEGIVPVSFSLSAKNSVMIISGANAGGKTVVLKTAGLLSLMAVSGLPVPAKTAKVPFYSAILADIGDQQSIAANLSTFSSHISNIASMMKHQGKPSLILLDEVGTGTDPDEGSALGVAIVDYFRTKGAQVIASTHYKGLKIYAANDADVINASVEFDEKTLQPTYRLLTGLAGASSGLEIARRFGIRDDVIEEARKNLDTAARKSEIYLAELQRETKQAADLRVALEAEREATAQKYSLLDLDFHKKERSRREQFEKELERVVDKFDKKAKEFLKSVSDKKERKKLEKHVAESRASLKREIRSKTTVAEAAKGVKVKKAAAAAGPIEAGSTVLLKNFGTEGRVEKLDGNIAHVLVGSIHMKQDVADLLAVAATKKTAKPTTKAKKSAGESLDSKFAGQSSAKELNLIGMTTLDAEDEVDRFLEDSYAAKIMRLRIIHGHGTGALRNAVQKYLKGHPHVESFGFAPQNEGGHGATIVELKA